MYKLTLDDIKDIVNNFRAGYNGTSVETPTMKGVQDELKLEGYLKSKYYDKQI